MTRTTILAALVGLALLALGIGVYVVLNPSDTPPSPPPTTSAITPYDRTLGDPKAPVTLIEYAAPMCPICANFNAREFPQLKAQYIDTGKVFYVFRVFPIGPPDYPVEGIARCLPKEQYFPFIDMMYRSQESWDPDGHDIPDVRAAILARARIAGLGTEQATRCMDDRQTQARITQNQQDAATRYGVTGTPTFVVGDQVVYTGEYPWDQLQAMLDARLAKQP